MLQKPDKIFLENSNWGYSLRKEANIGTVRETFLVSQLLNSNLTVSLPKSGDFYVEENDLIIEVGGESKTAKQVYEYDNYLIAVDDIETGRGKKVPLWVFGFLY